MPIKYTDIFHCKTLKNYTNLEYGFENIASGNPGYINRIWKWIIILKLNTDNIKLFYRAFLNYTTYWKFSIHEICK
jgi:hypothetical protein